MSKTHVINIDPKYVKPTPLTQNLPTFSLKTKTQIAITLGAIPTSRAQDTYHSPVSHQTAQTLTPGPICLKPKTIKKP